MCLSLQNCLKVSKIEVRTSQVQKKMDRKMPCLKKPASLHKRSKTTMQLKARMKCFLLLDENYVFVLRWRMMDR